MAYSMDLRERAVAAYNSGLGTRKAIAKMFIIGVTTLGCWLRLQKKTGSVQRMPQKGGPKPLIDDDGLKVLKELLDNDIDATQQEMAYKYEEKTGVKVSSYTIGRGFKRIIYTRKKKSLRATERDRDDVRKKRTEHEEFVESEESDKFVFVDETGANTKMTRTHAWSPKNERAEDSAPANWGKNITLIGSMSKEGLGPCMSIEGSVNTAVFQAYVDQVLVPDLEPGKIVFLDNLSSHKGAGIEKSIEDAGCKLVFLPPYSPDFNPIELVWSKFKSILRTLKARTTEALEEAISSLMDEIKPEEAEGYFRKCGIKMD